MMVDKENFGKKKSSAGTVIKIAILVVIIIALAYLYEMYGTLPVSILSAAISGKPLNFQTFSSVINQKLQSEDVGAKYTGSIKIASDPPFNFTFEDADGAYLYGLIAQDLPGFGSPQLTFTFTPYSNSVYLFCEDGSPAIAHSLANSGLNATSGELNGTEALCFKPTINNSTESFRFLNVFMNLYGFQNISTQSLGLGSYGSSATPCYNYAGTGSAEINSTIVGSKGQYYMPATMKFNTCISSQYMIPLSLSATFTAQNGKTVSVSMQTYGLIFNQGNLTGFISPITGN